MTDATKLDEAAIRARVEAATEEIGRLHPDARPGSLNAAQRDRITAAVADLPAALDENARLREALREAETEVQRARSEMGQWRRLAHERITRAEAAEKERDEARAEVERMADVEEAHGAAILDRADALDRAEAAESALAAVRALVPDECWVLRAPASGPVCTDMVGGGLPDGPKWTEDMCCLPCRLRAALATPTTTEGSESDD